MVDAGGKTISLFPFVLPFLLDGGGVIMVHSETSFDHPSIVYH
jgi:hypothetical protein